MSDQSELSLGDEVRPPHAFPATERRYLQHLLMRLSVEQLTVYEARCKQATRHHSSGRLYDWQRAVIAEGILAEAAWAKQRQRSEKNPVTEEHPPDSLEQLESDTTDR